MYIHAFVCVCVYAYSVYVRDVYIPGEKQECSLDLQAGVRLQAVLNIASAPGC